MQKSTTIKLSLLALMLLVFAILFMRCTRSMISTPLPSSSYSPPPPVDEYANLFSGVDTSGREKALKLVKEKRDDISGSCWAKHTNAPATVNQRSSMYLYYDCSDKSANALRLVMTYTGDDWLFVDSYIIKTDANRYAIDAGEVKRDNGSGIVWEWSDERVTSNEVPMIKDVISSKDVTIRFQGPNYYQDVKLREKDKKAMRDIILSFSKFRES